MFSRRVTATSKVKRTVMLKQPVAVMGQRPNEEFRLI